MMLTIIVLFLLLFIVFTCDKFAVWTMASVRPKETPVRKEEGKKEEGKAKETSPQKRKAEDDSTMEVTEVGHCQVKSRSHIYGGTQNLREKKNNNK